MQRTLGNRTTQRLLEPRGRAPDILLTPKRNDHASETKAVGAAIQRASGKKTGSAVEDVGELKWQYGALPAGQQKAPKPASKASDVKEWTSLVADTIKTPASAAGGFGGAEKKVSNSPASGPRYLAEVGTAETRGNLKFASSAMSPAGDVASVASGFAAIIELRGKLQGAKGVKRTEIILELLDQAGKTTAGGGKAAADTVKLVANSVAKANPSNAAAKAASTFSAGIGDILGALGSVFGGVISAAKLIVGVVKAVGGARGKDAIAGILTNFLSMGKGFLAATKSGLSMAKNFLDFAGNKGTEFAKQVPVIGSVINIVSQSLDVLNQAIKTVMQAMKMARAKRYQLQMEAAAGSAAAAGQGNLTKYLGGINVKRFKRGWLTVASAVTTAIADVVSMVGSIVQLATGGATPVALAASAGMAAGSGVLKLGAAAIKPIAKVIRTGKQKIRNAGALRKGAGSKAARAIGKALHIDMTKTSWEKLSELNKSVDQLLTFIENLPPAGQQYMSPDQVQQYELANQMIKATGLKPKELATANDREEIKDKLRQAMLARE